jgi:hypothetical protein
VIYVLREYRLSVADLEPLRAAREDAAWPRLEQAGAVPLGLFRVLLGGRPGDALELIRFDDLTHWARATGGGRQVSEDGWAPVREIGLRPASRRHPGGAPAPVVDRAAVWALRRWRPQPGALARVVELSEDRLWPNMQDDDELVFTLGMLHAHAAEPDELLMLTHYATLGDWERTRPGVRYTVPGGGTRAWVEIVEIVREREALIEEHGVRLLAPLSRRGPTRETCTEQGGGR